LKLREPSCISRLCATAAIGFMLLLSGCDYVNGVQDGTKLSEMPDLRCVTSVVRQAPGVVNVDLKTEKDTGSEITFTGLHPEEPVYYFMYSGKTPEQMGGVVQFQPNWRGYTDFVQSDLWIDRPAPQSQIDATRPVMREIEQDLALHCEIPELKTPLQQMCTGVRCPPLPPP
jgi:hypothetical protein